MSSPVDKSLIQKNAHLRIRYNSRSGNCDWREIIVASDGILQRARYKGGDIFEALHDGIEKTFYVHRVLELRPACPYSEGEPSDDETTYEEDLRIEAMVGLVVKMHETLLPITPVARSHPIIQAIETFDKACYEYRRGIKRAAPPDDEDA